MTTYHETVVPSHEEMLQRAIDSMNREDIRRRQQMQIDAFVIADKMIAKGKEAAKQ